MPLPYGELAALATAFMWSFGLVQYTLASKKIGVLAMNHYRMTFGILCLMVLHLVLKGTPWHTTLQTHDILILGISGLSGFFIGDLVLSQACLDLGPRIAILVSNSSPFVGALMGYVFLNETLSGWTWLGMLVTMSGVVLVVLEKTEFNAAGKRRSYLRGILCALGYALAQSIGFVLAKPIMTSSHGVDPLSVTLVRGVFGCLAFWVVGLARRQTGSVIKAFSETKSMVHIFAGALVSLAIGAWLSAIAIKLAPLGVASTIIALMPITVLPITIFVNKERVSWRAATGAIIACLGVAILFNY